MLSFWNSRFGLVFVFLFVYLFSFFSFCPVMLPSLHFADCISMLTDEFCPLCFL